MKPKASLRFLLGCSIIALLAAPSLHALTYYWDSDGSTTGFGNTTGTWGTNAFWTTVAGGGATHTAVTATTTADVVNFGSTTLDYANGTVGIAAGGVTATSIVFGLGQTTALTVGTTGGAAITLGGATRSIISNSTGHAINAPITLTGNSTISFSRNTSATGSFTLGGGIGGTGNVTFTTPDVNSAGNAQTINLGGAGTWSGTTTMTTGNANNATTIRNTSGAANALPTTTVLTMTGGTGAGTGRAVTFDLNGQNQELAGLQNTLAVDRDQRVTSSTAATLTINNSANYIFGGYTGSGGDDGSGQITGAIALTKTGVGTFTLAAGIGQTYTGITTINGGGLRMEHANSLGGTASGTVVNGSGTASSGNARLELAGGISTNAGESLTINGAGNFNGALTSASGNNKWQGTVTIGSSGTRIGAVANATLEVSGVIDSGIVSTGLNIRTANTTDSTVILSGANTYLGETTLVVGKLQIAGGNDRLPVGTTLRLTGTTLTNATEFDLNGFNQEVAGISLGSGNADFNSVNNSSLTGSTLTVRTAASPSTFGGILKGNLGLTKEGANSLTLTGTNNSYNGETKVNQGTLIVDGNISTSVLTTVASGATIAGSGEVGALTIESGGTVAPGNSPGILDTGDYTQAGTYNVEINGLTAGSDHDQINVTGTVDITGGSLNITSFTGAYSANDLIFILLNDLSDDITGFYTGFAQGAVVANYGGFDWQISYEADSTEGTFTGGNDIALMAVPEPGAALLGGIGVLLLFRRRRA